MKSVSSATPFAKSIPDLLAESEVRGDGAKALMPRSVLIVPVSKDTSAEPAARNITDYLQHEIGFRVLLIDGRLSEMTAPVEGMDEAGFEPGLADVIEGSRTQVSELLRREAGNDWYVLPAGNAAGRLSHRRIREGFALILDQVCGDFDYIIIHTLEPEDCPVAKALAGMADITSVCVEDRRTNASTFRNAWDLLKNHDASHLSIILEKRPPVWASKLYRKIQDKLPFKLPFEL